MSIRLLPRDAWGAYFEQFSRSEGTEDYAEIRVAPPHGGAAHEAPWLPLRGLSYDAETDLLEVHIEGAGPRTAYPRTIYVDEASGRLNRLEVARLDGTREVVTLR